MHGQNHIRFVLVCVSYCRPFAGSPADDRRSSVWL